MPPIEDLLKRLNEAYDYILFTGNWEDFCKYLNERNNKKTDEDKLFDTLRPATPDKGDFR